MNIDRKDWSISADLNWEDWRRLTEGLEVGDRYDGENKLLIRMKDSGIPEAVIDRNNMDIYAFVPEQVLKDVRFPFSAFSLEKGNVKIYPDAGPCRDFNLQIYYPGSLKVLDVPCFLESLPVE